MADRRQERAAIALLIESVRLIRSVELVIHRDNPDDFPDFILFNRMTSKDIWVEVVEAVESDELISAEHRAQRLYDAAAREYRARGKEVVLTVSPQGVESVTQVRDSESLVSSFRARLERSPRRSGLPGHLSGRAVPIATVLRNAQGRRC